ncbi:MAG TPA: MarR family transcriptional regulator [Nocardioides sp.]|nr:MarR family transcriptional regulator [Nocardioides sp.]
MTGPTREEAVRRLEQEVGVLLRRVRRAIGERARAVDPELQPSAYLMLGYIRENGPVRASVMCTVFDLDKGAVSRQVQHLLDLGFVDRAPDPSDGRATLLTVSAEAVRRMDAVAAERREGMAERLGDWTTGEMLELVGSLARYNQALDAAHAPA